MWITEKIIDIDIGKNGINLIAVVGFPGMGLVGKTVAEYLKSSLGADLIARIYGYGFPAHLLSYEDGYADIIHVDLHYAKKDSIGILIITSDIQPISDRGQHSLSRYIIKQLKELSVRELIAAAAYVSETTSHSRNVYVVGNNPEAMRKYIDKGAVPLSGGVISGLNGVIVGWAKLYKIDAVCLLGETWRSIAEMNYVDYTAAKSIVDVISNVWRLNIDTRELDEKGISVENHVGAILEQYLRKSEAERGTERRPYYIT